MHTHSLTHLNTYTPIMQLWDEPKITIKCNKRNINFTKTKNKIIFVEKKLLNKCSNLK